MWRKMKLLGNFWNPWVSGSLKNEDGRMKDSILFQLVSVLLIFKWYFKNICLHSVSMPTPCILFSDSGPRIHSTYIDLIQLSPTKRALRIWVCQIIYVYPVSWIRNVCRYGDGHTPLKKSELNVRSFQVFHTPKLVPTFYTLQIQQKFIKNNGNRGRPWVTRYAYSGVKLRSVGI